MAGRFCQECGAPNDAAATRCATCGAVLKEGIPPGAAGAAVLPPPAGAPPGAGPPPYGPPPTYGPPVYGPPGYGYPGYGGYPGAVIPDYAGMERRRQVDRTKYGVLVLALAMLVSLVPFFGTVCLSIVLFLVGLILMAIGRKAFGGRHAAFVMGSVALVVLYVVLLVVLSVWFVLVIDAAARTGDLGGISATFWTYLGGVLAAGFLEAIAWVLIVHELENRLGRFLLYGAFVALVLIQVAVLVLLAPQVNAILAALQNGTLTDPNDPRILELDSVTTTLSLVGAVPTILFAGAYLLAYLRVSRGDVPGTPPPAPAAPWPPAPSPYVPPPGTPSPPPAGPASPPAGPPPGPGAPP